MRMRMKLACIPLFIGACVLFYFGSGMLLLVPGYPGESYLKSLFAGRFLYGVLPTLSSMALVFGVAWLWNRSNGSSDLLATVVKTALLAIAATVLFWIGVIIASNVHSSRR